MYSYCQQKREREHDGFQSFSKKRTVFDWKEAFCGWVDLIKAFSGLAPLHSQEPSPSNEDRRNEDSNHFGQRAERMLC